MSEPYCDAVEAGYQCVRKVGHRGEHVAETIGGRVVRRWPAAAPSPVGTPAPTPLDECAVCFNPASYSRHHMPPSYGHAFVPPSAPTPTRAVANEPVVIEFVRGPFTDDGAPTSETADTLTIDEALYQIEEAMDHFCDQPLEADRMSLTRTWREILEQLAARAATPAPADTPPTTEPT